jgi:Ca-activated chloride channel homolog
LPPVEGIKKKTVSWYRDFGLTEAILILAFIGLYAFYVMRVMRTARMLSTPFSNVFIKVILRATYFLLFIVALLGPSFGGAKKEVASVGKDIVICTDLSKSMDAFDIQPTRLEKVKFEMKRLVDAFNSDRIGIVIFSSEAFMQCPLTYDQNALNLFIDAMNSNLVPKTGTDFGPPLQLALNKLEADTDGPASQSKSKIIVLISDGEDFGEKTDDIVEEITKKNIRLFTLGVGTEKGGNIYAGNRLKKDSKGNTVITRLNPDALKSLARKTDGHYFEITESRNDVNRMINTIRSIEGELRGSHKIDAAANRYFYFLLLATILFITDIFLNISTIRI